MPGTIFFEIRGAKELQDLLVKLGPRPAERAGDRALREAAKPIIAEAKRLVPKRTRALMRSITYGPVKGSGKKAHSREGYIGFKRPISRRAHLTEFGTSHSAAQPFLRPAMDTKTPQALEILSQILAQSIEKEAKALTKKIR